MRDLSLKARLAIALRLFTRYCRHRKLQHDQIAAFIEHLWRFLAVRDSDEFPAWEANDPPLVAAALGDEFSPEFAAFLSRNGVRKGEFRRAITYTAEIVYDNLYCAADEAGSRRFLRNIAVIAAWHGVAWPDLSMFAGSRWADGAGWGQALRAEQVALWRSAGNVEPGVAPRR